MFAKPRHARSGISGTLAFLEQVYFGTVRSMRKSSGRNAVLGLIGSMAQTVVFVMVPGAQDYVITPIAPHNLNVRPVVVPDDRTIRLKIEGRGQEYLCSLDSRSVTINSAVELTIKKANFQLNVIQTENQNFLNTIRNKMMWGLDRRN